MPFPVLEFLANKKQVRVTVQSREQGSVLQISFFSARKLLVPLGSIRREK
jgi:hypothetical protein